MPKSWMIADFLRPYAQWRIDRAEERDGGRNARAAIGLIDAAAYAMQLDDSDRLIVRLAVAGCFSFERFNPGVEGERLVRRWHYDGFEGAPRDLLAALAEAAEAAEDGAGPGAAPPPPRESSRWRALDRTSRPLAGSPSQDADDAAAWFAEAEGKCPMDAPNARNADAPGAHPTDRAQTHLGDAAVARFTEATDAHPADSDADANSGAADSRLAEAGGPRPPEERSSRRTDGPGVRGKSGKGWAVDGRKGEAAVPRPPKPRRG
ncbi:hypothetical protein AB0J52_02800 [Spirillospora sp. NPDC049652]